MFFKVCGVGVAPTRPVLPPGLRRSITRFTWTHNLQELLDLVVTKECCTQPCPEHLRTIPGIVVCVCFNHLMISSQVADGSYFVRHLLRHVQIPLEWMQLPGLYFQQNHL